MSTPSLFWTMSLALTKQEFLEKWSHALIPESLPKGPLRFLLHSALEHWDLHHQLMERPAYQFWVDGAIDDADLHEDYLRIYTDIQAAYPITDSTLPVAWEAAEEWIQNYHVGMAIDRAREALAREDRAQAFSALLGLREVTGEEREEPLEIGEPLADLIRQSRSVKNTPIPVGIEQIDDALEGGILRGNLCLIAGPLNLGKSQFLCYLAASAYKANRRVLYVSYELTRLIIGERILTALFEKPKQELDPDTLAEELIEFREEHDITKGSIVIESSIPTVVELLHYLEETDFDLVLLDSADDMTPRQNYPSLYLSQGEIHQDIHQKICQGLNMPVWSAAQLNREAIEKARVSLRHIGDSLKKAQKSVLCIAMSQSVEESDYYLGPMLKLHLIKETQHGAKGKWWRFLTMFGKGPRGWPDFRYFPEKGALE